LATASATLDSGAGDHTFNAALMDPATTRVAATKQFQAANGAVLTSNQVGDVVIETDNQQRLVVDRARDVPGIVHNLISVSRLDE
jgi:hypothetical protein